MTADQNAESVDSPTSGIKEDSVDAKGLSSNNGNSSDDPLKETKLPTKIVLRRLPSSMTEKEFLNSVSPLPEHDHVIFSEADPTLKPHGLSRAIINLVDEEEVYMFKERFDGYVFVDNKGHEYPAIVEFAPSQKVPKKSRSRKDAKCGTIDNDPDFLKFVEILQNPPKSTRTVQQCLEDIDAREKEQKSKEKSTPLLDYIREKAEKKKQDREQRRDARRKREEERKKTREDERKRRKEKKEQEIREREKRDKDKRDFGDFSTADKLLGKSGNGKQHQEKRFVERDQTRTTKSERSHRAHRDEGPQKAIESSSTRRGSRGGYSSRNHKERSLDSSSNSRSAHKRDRNEKDKEAVSSQNQELDTLEAEQESKRSASKNSFKSMPSRNKDERRRDQEELKDERGITKSREERQKERNEREKERFRKREEERQRKWQEQKEERQRQKEAAAAADASGASNTTTCDSKNGKINEDSASITSNSNLTQKGIDVEIVQKSDTSAEISKGASSKSKRYSDRRKEDKSGREVSDAKSNRNKGEIGQNVVLDEMSKDLSNILNLEGDGTDEATELVGRQAERRNRGRDKFFKGSDYYGGATERKEKQDADKRKNKERPAMQIYKPGMGRLSSQANTKDGTSTKYEEERADNVEVENINYMDDERRSKQERGASRQKDRNNRSDKSGFDKQHKRYTDKPERHYGRGNDYDQEEKADVQLNKEHTKHSTKMEENRIKTEPKFDKSNWKSDRDAFRNDHAQKSTTKYDGTQRTGGYKTESFNSKDKDPALPIGAVGRNEKLREKGSRNYSYQPATPYPQNSQKSDTNTFKDQNSSKELVSENAEAASTFPVPAKDKERSGKSYSSKRRERQQQRGERTLDET